MTKIIFDLQRFSDSSQLDILKTFGGIITTLGLKKLAEDLDKAKDASKWLKDNANPILNFIGKKTPLGEKFGNYAKLITGSISIFDNTLAILQGNLSDADRAQKFGLISSSLESMASATEELIKSKKLTSKSSNLWFMSIVSAGISLVANIIAGSDGIKPKEKEAINRSYILFMRTLGTDLAKKIFNAATDAQFNRLLTENVMEEAIANGKFFQSASKTFTKVFGVVMTFGTGILNGVDKYKLSMEKYTADGISEKIAKHDAFVDALSKFIKETLSGIVVGLDDVIFNGSKWIFSLFGIKYAEDKEDYVEVLADYLKTLNYENSGTSGNDKFYVLENKSMVYGDSGNDDIGNYGFSNVTIWGGHDDDTLGSYKTDSATPQNNSIFGGPGDDQISVYDKDSTIYGGTGKDFINVVGTNNEIFGEADDDKFYITNGANNNTLSGDNGDDFIVMLEKAKNTVIKYASGDGNDTIYGFNEDDSLKISDSYKTTVDGNHLKITVGEGSILLVDMAGKNININGKTIKSGEENSTIEPVPPPEFPTLPATVASPIIYGTEGDDIIKNYDEKTVILTLGGDDSIDNYAAQVTIDGGAGNDLIKSGRKHHVSIDSGNGNDEIHNECGHHITISSGKGNDSIFNWSERDGTWNNKWTGCFVTINSGEGDDYILSRGASIRIDSDSGNDDIYNDGSTVTINAGDGDDSIRNYGYNVTINAGVGNDLISLDRYYASGSLIKYASGDGNDSIIGFISNDTLQIGNGTDTYFSQTSGDDVIVTVGDGKISLIGAASLSAVHIEGEEEIVETNSWTYSNGTAKYGTSSKTLVTVKGVKFADGLSIEGKVVTVDEASLNKKKVTISGTGYTLALAKGNSPTTKKAAWTYDNGTATYKSSYKTAGYKLASNAKSITYSKATTAKALATVEGAASATGLSVSGSKITLKKSALKNKVTVSGAYEFDFASDYKNATISGTAKADTITARGTNISISGGAGNDEIHNRNDFVKINGGDGDDRIWNEVSGTLSGGASVYVNAGTGNDTLYNDGDDSTLIGGNGEDYIENWNANVSIDAGASNDIIINNSSGNNSTIFGGAGNDYIDNRYAQNTLFKYKSGDGNDLIHGFNATSTLSITGSAYSTAKSGSDIVVTVGSNKITLAGAGTLSKANIVDATTLILNDKSSAAVTLASAVKTGDASKRTKAIKIIGNALANILNGGASNDTLSGAAGNDKLFGNVGNDSLVGGDGADTLSGGEGNDKLFGNAGNDSIAGGDGHDSINGGADNDKLFGNAGNDSLVGGDGADTLSGGAGNDKLYGDKGNDSLVGGSGDDYLNGGGGADKLFGESGDDKLYGGAGNDNLSGGTGSDTLSGGSGNDTLTGGKGHDLFIYSAGNDVIADFAAGDKISIGAAISGTSIKGSDATFTINKNTLTVKNGKGKEVTVINAKGKEQTLIGGALIVSKSATLENWREVGDASTATAKVKLTGNAKNNTLFGSSKDDTLIGAVGADKLFGNAGNDSLSGGDGADTLSGGAGNDKLYGGKGNDSLWGGAGNDSLWGNAGADTFIYANGEGKDVIYNFDNSDILQITGTFTSSYNKSKKEIAFTVGKTTSALTLKSFTATSFNINGDTYKISGSKLIK